MYYQDTCTVYTMTTATYVTASGHEETLGVGQMFCVVMYFLSLSEKISKATTNPVGQD